MEEQRARTRVWMRAGHGHGVIETVDEVLAQMELSDWVDVTSLNGAEIFGPERIVLNRNEIAALQEISEASWIWQKQADTLHYSRQLRDLEASGADRIVEVQQQLLEVLKGDEE